MSVDRGTIVRALRDNGLSGRLLCFHTSLRSFGGIEGGADGLIDAVLSEGCSLLVPTFTHEIYGRPIPQDMWLERNGLDYDDPSWVPIHHDRIFSPSTNEVAEGMGTLPRVLLSRPGRMRSNHPISSFAALGPLAEKLTAGGDIYAPLAALADLGGAVVLAGVDLNRMTIIHLAEKRSGRNLFRRCVNTPDGPTLVESGSCSEGFINLEPSLRQVRRDVTVGASHWQVFEARAALNVATHAIRRNQRITHCGKECRRCDDAVRGGPMLR